MDEREIEAEEPQASPAGDGGDDGAPGAAAERDPATVEDEIVEAFEKEIVEARKAADESHDKYLRAEADLQNLRRVSEQRRRQAQEMAKRELLGRFLEVADNLERALAVEGAEESPLHEGVAATLREMSRLLEREGVAPIEAADAPFDPAFHEAVGVVSLPGLEEERVISVERSGYTIHGELLRAARVVVGRPTE